VWLYFRFPLSFREVEELMLERGVIVSYETVRRWCAKFGQAYANVLRCRQPRPGDKWLYLLAPVGPPVRRVRAPRGLGVADKWLPFVASDAWPPGSPRRLGRRLGSANKSLCRAMLARSSVVRKASTSDWSTMSRIWAGTDCGKTHHHTLVLDADGSTLLSRRVANDEPELLKLIGDVLDLADGDRTTWALDMTGGEPGLLIALLVNHGQELVYIPGIAVNRATDSYRGQGTPSAMPPARHLRRLACQAAVARSMG
jgi:hypothetical protein